MIFFSVIIPTYNRVKLISETLDTVLNQSYKHFEVIVVDDGSTDNTSDIIREKYGTDSRISYHYKENEERGAARNYGLKQAKGDFAVFFDSDDRMLPHYLETLEQIIREFPDISFLSAKYNYDHDGKIDSHPVLSRLHEGWYDREIFLEGNILACNFCIRVKNHSAHQFPPSRDLASMEDWLFLLANLANDKIYIKDRVCVTMRQHEERSMSNNQKVISARRKAVAWILQNLDLNSREQKKMIGWSHYFCGIHQYLDDKRGAALKEIIPAIRKAGLNTKFIQLLIKSIIGRKLVSKFK